MAWFELLKSGTVVASLAASLLAGVISVAPSDPSDAEVGNVSEPDPYVLGHVVETIEGEKVDLREYEGRVVMIVNVASRCGLTPQYKELQDLFETYHDQGFTIFAFPANNFGGQEPGTNKQIAEFCQGTFGVEFPMFSKISVKGEDIHPLYRQLAEQPAPIGGEPKWNFTKYLLNRRGEVVARFEPRTTPQDSKLVEKVLELLADKDLRDGIDPWKPDSE